MNTVLELLTGDVQTFREKVWASRVLLHEVAPEALTGYLSLADADTLLTASGIRTPALRIAKDGAVLLEKSYTAYATMAGQPVSGLVDARKALALFDDGATIVFQGLHRYWPPLTDLVAGLERELGHPCQANAYLTPPGGQGFAVHADTHDVFVFQTAGRKQWEIHGPDGPEQVEFRPGLVAYLPTGTKHAARAQEAVSLHVTIGINQLTLRGLVQRSVQGALRRTPETHLPAGHLDDPGTLAELLRVELDALADRIRAIDVAGAVAVEQESLLTGRPSRVAGGLLDRVTLEALDDTTVVSRRRGRVCEVRPGTAPGSLDVLLGDRTLTVPERLRPAIEFIAQTPQFRPADLSGRLDEQSRVVLVRRLVREGLLTVRR